MGAWGVVVWIVALALGACGGPVPAPEAPPPAAEEPARETEAPPPPAPILVNAEELAGSPETNNCPVIVVRATRGETVLDEMRLQSECEDAPDYDCKDSGEGCATTTHELGEKVAFGTAHFVWIGTTSSWHHGDHETTALIGYACGKLTEVADGDSADQGIRTTVTISAAGGSHLRLEASYTETDFTAPDEKEEGTYFLVWDEKTCKYVNERTLKKKP